MSLHALAGHMATKGRGGDSMLVHMTPEEVQSLQAMALKGGGSLTINPDTGLPEANFLKKMLPMIAGLALAPLTAGTSLAFLAATPLATALTVGGITGLATGSLSRGLMAGLGAYGGASLGAGLAGAGAGAAQEAAMAGISGEQLAQQAVTSGLTEQGVLNQAARTATDNFLAQGAGSQLAQGATAAFNNPSSLVQSMGGLGKTAQAGLAAISPIMADQGVQTTTKMPSTGTIRNYTFDPYGQTYTSAGDYPANEAERKASGGIVALAEGGLTPEQFKQQMYEGGLDASAATKRGLEIAAEQGLNAQQTTDLWNQALGTKFTPDDYSRVSKQYGVAGPQSNVDFVKNLATNTSTAADFGSEINSRGLSQQDVTAALLGSGLSGGAQFALTNQNIGDTRNVEETYGGLKGLSSNINYWIANNPGASLNDFQNEMRKYELNEDDIKRATGKTSNQLYTGKLTTVVNPAEGASGATGAGAIGGGTVVNANGTITTSPRIPGIPEGGFTGMGQVRDVYTTGGGSLGYTNQAPKDMEEFNTRFNKQTGDSLAAYNYLMGKGANPTKSGVGEIMRPYSEASLGVPAAEGRPTQKYIYDPVKRVYVENPNYQPLSYNSKGERNVGSSSVKAAQGFEVLKPAQTQANFDYVTYLKNNPGVQSELDYGVANFGTKADPAAAAYSHYTRYGKGEGRPFTMLPGAKPADDDVFAWADTNKVSDAQLVPLMGISLAEVVKRRAKYKKPDAPATVVDTTVPVANGGLLGMAAGGYAVGGGLGALAGGGSTSQYNLGGYSDGGRLLRGPGDGVSDSIPATIGNKQPARLADGEFVVPARIVSELGNGSTEAGARKLYAMMDRVQKARGKTTGKNRVAANTRSEQHLPA